MKLICPDCQQSYVGHGSSKRCLDCRAIHMEEQQRKWGKIKYQRQKAKRKAVHA